MTAAYYSILTNNGKALIANATVSTPVGFSNIAVGDGNGSVPTPLETRTALVNEKARFTCNSVALNPNNTNWIEAEIIIPTTSGGYTIRELGLYAGATLVAVANFPSTYKPLETEGGAREIAIKMVINVQNAEVISVTLDNSLVYATRDWVNTYYIPRTDIVDNLTTNDASKPVSAKQAKVLQDNKLAKTGNAVSASKLLTSRKIGGVSFDGSTDINLPGVNQDGNQNTSGNAATASKLQIPRKINDVSFDGTSDITIVDSTRMPLSGGQFTGRVNFQDSTWNLMGNDCFIGDHNVAGGICLKPNTADYAAIAFFDKSDTWVATLTPYNYDGNAETATKLATARKIGGVSFDGSADISFPFLGEGQTYKEVTSSRTLNTTYTNTTNKLMWVSAAIWLSAGATLSGYVDGNLQCSGFAQQSSSNSWAGLLVPPGSTYKINGSSITKWMEYSL